MPELINFYLGKKVKLKGTNNSFKKISTIAICPNNFVINYADNTYDTVSSLSELLTITEYMKRKNSLSYLTRGGVMP